MPVACARNFGCLSKWLMVSGLGLLLPSGGKNAVAEGLVPDCGTCRLARPSGLCRNAGWCFRLFHKAPLGHGTLSLVPLRGSPAVSRIVCASFPSLFRCFLLSKFCQSAGACLCIRVNCLGSIPAVALYAGICFLRRRFRVCLCPVWRFCRCKPCFFGFFDAPSRCFWGFIAIFVQD